MFRQAKTRKINRNFQIQHMSGFIIQNPMKHGTCLENLDTIMVFMVHCGSLNANLKETWKIFGPQAGTMGCLVNLVKIGECFTRL